MNSRKILIYGNSGSGKTSMAGDLARKHKLAYLELDLLAWASPGVRREFDGSLNEMIRFIEKKDNWVIEGVYGSLVQEAAYYCSELHFLNPGLEMCLKNNRSCPWEPQKYDTEEAQNRNSEMLQDWVKKYETREDECSIGYHREIFYKFNGKKKEHASMLEY